jgi:hypothetical protein
MRRRNFPRNCRLSIIALVSVFSPLMLAQGPAPDAPAPAAEPVATALAGPVVSGSEHNFWDKENYALFAATAATSMADFAVTRANLQSGGQELNPIVRIFGRSTAGLAVNFAGETAGVMGLSYFCHRTGHHRLERMVSAVNIGASVGAVSYGLAHRDAITNNTAMRVARQAGPFSIRIRLASK